MTPKDRRRQLELAAASSTAPKMATFDLSKLAPLPVEPPAPQVPASPDALPAQSKENS